MTKRHSIFGVRRQPAGVDSPPSADYPLTIFMDESGNGDEALPLIVGAVCLDVDAADVEQAARALYEELSAREALTGYESYDKFVAKGFHASTDPYEVSVPFLELLQRTIGFKVYMVMTDRSTLRPLTEKQQVAVLYEILLGDILIRYKNYRELYCYIEGNDALGGLVRSLPSGARIRAADKLDRQITLPALKVNMIPKADSMSMALVDYAMMAVSRWARVEFARDMKQRGYREFRQVEPTISHLSSLELGTISARRFGLH